MIIANPIYDVVFKRLMENDKVAKFFIGTLLEQTIEAVEVKPQEYTYKGELETPQGIQAAEERIRERFSIWVYRLDFIATIRTETGELKKVLIEIQKAKNPIDLMRFRNYLAEQYKKEDKINHENIVLPITTIYILGFKLPEIESPCIRVKRDYIDLIHKTTLTQKSDFVEKLTHDCFVVQVERITDRYQTRLDKLLSVFEQRNFTDDKEITKDFIHNPDIDELKTMTDILHYVGTDPQERKQIEIEQEARRTIDAMLEDYQKKLAEKDKTLNEQQQTLNEQQQALNEQQQTLNEQQQTLNEQQQNLNEKDKLIEELLKKLNEQK
ncbi:MAG: hypothetical protein NW226_05565 [Microscillaceae bacterium]|nr:hypothetical protein [Microscillaceae bacterium]